MNAILRLIIPSIILLLSACSRLEPDARLAGIADAASSAPQEALDSLAAIDYTSLSEADRHYHDFLTIKASDKAYISHTSDSLILDVIDYESSHQSRGLYPEALYYGGRVYSDLGDYPTALQYFQQSLDLLESSNNLSLKHRVLSQTGRLLNSLRLYEKSIPYINEAISIESILKDSITLMYDNQLLGGVYFDLKKYDIAESKFKFAREIAEKVSPIDVHTENMYLAAIMFHRNQLDSALTLIRTVANQIDTINRNTALAHAALIYLKSGIRDTSLIYANELMQNMKGPDRRFGYYIALTPEMNTSIPTDSLYSYISTYVSLTENDLNKNASQEALLQNTLYNYSLHERKRIKAEQEKNSLYTVVGCILFLAFGLVITILYLKNRNKTNLLRLHDALNRIKILQESISRDTTLSPQQKNTLEEDADSRIVIINKHFTQNQHELTYRLRKELTALLQQSNEPHNVAHAILNSQAYSELKTYISNEKIVVESNPLWDELEKAVIESSPDFKHRLRLLTGGKMKILDYHLALLIRCGVTPTQMTFLIGKTKGTISYRREKLCLMVFGQKLEPKAIDKIINLL